MGRGHQNRTLISLVFLGGLFLGIPLLHFNCTQSVSLTSAGNPAKKGSGVRALTQSICAKAVGCKLPGVVAADCEERVFRLDGLAQSLGIQRAQASTFLEIETLQLSAQLPDSPPNLRSCQLQIEGDTCDGLATSAPGFFSAPESTLGVQELLGLNPECSRSFQVDMAFVAQERPLPTTVQRMWKCPVMSKDYLIALGLTADGSAQLLQVLDAQLKPVDQVRLTGTEWRFAGHRSQVDACKFVLFEPARGDVNVYRLMSAGALDLSYQGVPSGTAQTLEGAELQDFTQDGHDDLLLFGQQGIQLYQAILLGGSKFDTTLPFPKHVVPTIHQLRRAGSGEVQTVLIYNSNLQIYYSTQTSPLDPAMAPPNWIQSSWQMRAPELQRVMDLNQDGWEDLILGNWSNKRVEVLFGGTELAQNKPAQRLGGSVGLPSDAVFWSIGGESYVAIVGAGAGSNVEILRVKSVSPVTTELINSYFQPLNAFQILALDVDDNGKMDLVVPSSLEAKAQVFYQQ